MRVLLLVGLALLVGCGQDCDFRVRGACVVLSGDYDVSKAEIRHIQDLVQAEVEAVFEVEFIWERLAERTDLTIVYVDPGDLEALCDGPAEGCTDYSTIWVPYWDLEWKQCLTSGSALAHELLHMVAYWELLWSKAKNERHGPPIWGISQHDTIEGRIWATLNTECLPQPEGE